MRFADLDDVEAAKEDQRWDELWPGGLRQLREVRSASPARRSMVRRPGWEMACSALSIESSLVTLGRSSWWGRTVAPEPGSIWHGERLY